MLTRAKRNCRQVRICPGIICPSCLSCWNCATTAAAWLEVSRSCCGQRANPSTTSADLPFTVWSFQRNYDPAISCDSNFIGAVAERVKFYRSAPPAFQMAELSPSSSPPTVPTAVSNTAPIAIVFKVSRTLIALHSPALSLSHWPACCRFCHGDQCGQHIAEPVIAFLAQAEIQFVKQRIQVFVSRLRRSIGHERPVPGANLVLRFLNGFESARGQESKNCRPETSHALARNQHRAP
jgi:hypothetical protein